MCSPRRLIRSTAAGADTPDCRASSSKRMRSGSDGVGIPAPRGDRAYLEGEGTSPHHEFAFRVREQRGYPMSKISLSGSTLTAIVFLAVTPALASDSGFDHGCSWSVYDPRGNGVGGDADGVTSPDTEGFHDAWRWSRESAETGSGFGTRRTDCHSSQAYRTRNAPYPDSRGCGAYG